jgi:phage gpG-like protein
MIKVQVTDSGVVDAFNRLIALGEHSQGALAAIGEKMYEFTKSRFEKSVDPYDEPWAVNSDVTLRVLLHSSGKNFTKKGALSKRGNTVLAGKKPLIGESKSLSTQFGKTVIGDDLVTVSSTMAYAAMQQFGGAKSDFPNLWGDIPARPFFPNADRGLPDELSQVISDVLRDAIQGVIDG